MQKETVREFCVNTAIHGLSHAVKQNSLPFRIVWIVVVVVGFTGLSSHLYYIIHSFLQYKATESIYEKNNGYRFPDVTICSYNAISHSNLEKAAKGNFPRVKYFYDDILNKSDSFPTTFVPVTKAALFWALGDEAYHIGHKASDMVLRCRFNRSNCSVNDLVLFHFYTYFNCYQFIEGQKSDLITNYGMAEGLSLILYMEPHSLELNHQYFSANLGADGTGFRVLITPSNYIGAVGNDAYDIKAGMSTSFGFYTTEQIRLPDPFSQCRIQENDQLGKNVPYSFIECRNMCVHKLVWDECGCVSTVFITRGNINGTSCGDYLFTNKTKSDELMRCQSKELARVRSINFQEMCRCFSPCEDTTYQISLSQSAWPDRDVLGSFITSEVLEHPDRENLKAYKDYQTLVAKNATKDDIYHWVLNHFVRLNIFARSNIVKVREQVPLYTATDLMSQIGGCLGLWVGMSVITIVEIFELAVKLFVQLTNSEMRRK